MREWIIINNRNYYDVFPPKYGGCLTLRLIYLFLTWPGNDWYLCTKPQPTPWWVWCILIPIVIVALTI